MTAKQLVSVFYKDKRSTKMTTSTFYRQHFLKTQYSKLKTVYFVMPLSIVESDFSTSAKRPTPASSLNLRAECAEVRSRMRALDCARAGINIAQLNDSSRSPYILFSIFRISNGLHYGHKQTLSIYYNI